MIPALPVAHLLGQADELAQQLREVATLRPADQLGA
jgi:hypothetical protein